MEKGRLTPSPKEGKKTFLTQKMEWHSAHNKSLLPQKRKGENLTIRSRSKEGFLVKERGVTLEKRKNVSTHD